jgi:mRNA interferase RelE/StbE
VSSGWTLEFSDAARKAFRRLGKDEADRITRTLREIAQLDDPRQRGHILTGTLGGLWRYRVGDWRVIARIEDKRLVILVIEIGHRSEIYR